MPRIDPAHLKSISQNPILVPTSEVLAKTEFDKYLGARRARRSGRTRGGDQGGVTIERAAAPPPAAPRRRPLDTGRVARLALLAPTLVITVVCFIMPLGLIAVYSFGSVNLVDFNVFFGWTTGNYRAFRSILYLDTLARSVVLSARHDARMRRARVHVRLLHQPPGPEGPATAARRSDRAVLDELHRPHLLVGRPAPEPRADRPVRPRARNMHGLHIDILYTPTSIGIGIVYSYLPLMILPIYVSLERIDPALYNAAADLGRDAVAAVPPRRAAARRARADRREHHRRRPGARRVRDPRDPRRRQDADGRQHHRRTSSWRRATTRSARRWPSRMMVAADACCSSCCAGPSRAAERAREHPPPSDRRRLSLLVLLFMWLPLIVVAVELVQHADSLMAGWGGFTTHWYSLAVHDQNVRAGLETTLGHRGRVGVAVAGDRA